MEQGLGACFDDGAHAYKNTNDSSMKVKWQIVLICLKTGDQSIDYKFLDITSIALQNHFKGIMEEIEKKGAMSE